MIQKCYDQANRRLIFYGAVPGPSFWDAHWLTEDFVAHLKNARKSFVVKITRQYLSSGAKILEGGCGRGDKVYALHTAGYDVHGIDLAPETIRKIKSSAPELKVSLGDVRQLDFPDSCFDGYWSLGVIEHFWEGYDATLAEMIRVLRPGGYAFVTFPSTNWLRKRKIRLCRYSSVSDAADSVRSSFYQFILDPETVVQDFQKMGLQVVALKRLDGIKGLKDEVAFLHPILQRLYDSSGALPRLVRQSLNVLLSPFSGHLVLAVFQKTLQ